MKAIEEFRKFAMRGSVIDLAVGVVVGAAFTAIVNSLVKDIVTPPIGLLLGGIDLSNFFFVFSFFRAFVIEFSRLNPSWSLSR